MESSTNARRDPASKLAPPREGSAADRSDSTIPDSPPTPESLRPLNIRTRSKRVSTTVFEQVLRNQQRTLSATQMSSVPSEPATPEGMSPLEIRRRKVEVPVDTFVRALKDSEDSQTQIPSEPATPDGMSVLQVGRKKVKVSVDTFLKALEDSGETAESDDSVFRRDDARSSATINLTTAGSLVPSRPVSRREHLREPPTLESVTDEKNSDEVVEFSVESLEVSKPSEPLHSLKDEEEEVLQRLVEAPTNRERVVEESQTSPLTEDKLVESIGEDGEQEDSDPAVTDGKETDDARSAGKDAENRETEPDSAVTEETKNGKNQPERELSREGQDTQDRKDENKEDGDDARSAGKDAENRETEPDSPVTEETKNGKNQPEGTLSREGQDAQDRKDRSKEDEEYLTEEEEDEKDKSSDGKETEKENDVKEPEKIPTEAPQRAEHKISVRGQRLAKASTPARSTATSRLVSSESFNLSPIPAASVSTFRGHVHETRHDDSLDEESDSDDDKDDENYETAEEDEIPDKQDEKPVKDEQPVSEGKPSKAEKTAAVHEKPATHTGAKSVLTNPAKGKTLSADVQAHLELLRRACAISNSRPPPPAKYQPLSERMKNYSPEEQRAAEVLQKRMNQWAQREEPSPLPELPKKRQIKKSTAINQRPKKPKLADNIASFAANRTNFNFYSRLSLTKEAAVEVHKMVDEYTDAILEATANYCEEKGIPGVDKPDDFLAIMKRMGLVDHEHDYASMVQNLMWDDYRKFLLPVGLPANVAPPTKKRKK